MDFRVITGGQTGVDQAAWRAAKEAGCATGGWMPRGFLTEDGARPEFRRLYGAREMMARGYPERTRANVGEAGLVLWLGPVGSRGYACTLRACAEFCPGTGLLVEPDPWATVRGDLVTTLARHRHVCVAGSRESRCPGIGEAAERYCGVLFTLVRNRPPEETPR
jgi:hypothetical protein